MKKIIIYTLTIAILSLLGYSAYKEATKTGAKVKRLPCHQNVTVFEKVHLPEAIDKFKAKDAKLSASVKLVPSVYQAPQLFNIISQSEIEKQVINHFKADLNSKLPLHVEVMVLENDKLDPGKKNDDAKSFLGYVRTSYYQDNNLAYQVQIDFLKPDGINKALQCAYESLLSL